MPPSRIVIWLGPILLSAACVPPKPTELQPRATPARPAAAIGPGAEAQITTEAPEIKGTSQQGDEHSQTSIKPTTSPKPPEPEPHPADPYLLEDEPPRCPPEMALVLNDRCIDRWEASLLKVLPRGKVQKASPFETPNSARGSLRAVSRPNVVPQAYISGTEAMRACRAAGKRLCSAREWVAACRGPRNTTYPYGDERRAQVCNDDGRRRHPVVEVSHQLGLDPKRMWYEGMAHPLINQLKGTVDKTGANEECTSKLGTFDMVGNLHEWVEDPAGTFRGGFFMDTRINGEGCQYKTTAHSIKYHDYSTGFRCCKDADEVE